VFPRLLRLLEVEGHILVFIAFGGEIVKAQDFREVEEGLLAGEPQPEFIVPGRPELRIKIAVTVVKLPPPDRLRSDVADLKKGSFGSKSGHR